VTRETEVAGYGPLTGARSGVNSIHGNASIRSDAVGERADGTRDEADPKRVARPGFDVVGNGGISRESSSGARDKITNNGKHAGTDAVLTSDIGRAVSAVYFLSPPGEQLYRGAELSFDLASMKIDGSELEGLSIYTWTDEGWIELNSHLNSASNRITTTVDALGSYQLRSSGTAGSSPLPKAFSLSQNFPNPFNPSTTIGFDIPEKHGEVWTELIVYNVRGQRVKTLLRESKVPGAYYIQWDGRNDNGQKVASGIYLYRLKAGEFVSTRKMVLVK
jgi:hypothetical protein